MLFILVLNLFHPTNADLAPPKSPPPENIKGPDFYCFYYSPLNGRLSSLVPFGAAPLHRRRRAALAPSRVARGDAAGAASGVSKPGLRPSVRGSRHRIEGELSQPYCRIWSEAPPSGILRTALAD